MKQPDFLSTAPQPLPSMRFDELLRTGLEACQRLGGERWTDYNEHDPGVTILEQLGYALTDAGYRLNYEVPDLLAAAPGQPDPDLDSTLFPGDLVLSCQPLTRNDYRKLMYDQVVNLRNAWLEPVAAVPGTYRLLLEKFGNTDDPAMAQHARDLYHAHRNLGEDLSEVLVLGQVRLAVKGRLHIVDNADPGEVLADVLFAIQAMLTPNPRFQAVDDKFAAGIAPDAVFDGPWLECGVLDDAELAPLRTRVSVRDVRSVILRHPKVRMVDQLAIRDMDAGQEVSAPEDAELSTDDRHIFSLQVPDSRAAWEGLQVQWKDKTYPVDVARVARLYQQHDAAIATAERFAQQREETLAYRHTPAGTYRDPARYHSIQHQFPVTYGIGRYGVTHQPWFNRDGLAGAALQDGGQAQAPDARRQRHAQVRQLKAYLLFFEQILTNHFAQLANVGRLYSTDEKLQQSYFYQPLAHATPLPGDPPDILPILKPGAGQAPAGAEKMRHVLLFHGRRHQHHAGKALLRSRPAATPDESRRAEASILERGRMPEAYRTRRVGPGRGSRIFLVILSGADGEALAFGTARYRSAEAAGRGIERMLAWMHWDHRKQHVERRAYGVLQLLLTDQRGKALLRIADLTRAEYQAAHAALLLNGQQPRRYRLPHCGCGRIVLQLGEQAPLRDVEILAEVDSEAQALAVRDALMAWLGRLACDASLRERHLPGIPAQAPEPPVDGLAAYEAGLARLMRKFDPELQRRGQFLDHLLARFGEGFDDTTLARLDPRPLSEKGAFYAELNSWKTSFLRHVAPTSKLRKEAARLDLGGRRSQGCDYTAPDTVSAMEQRLRLLLGIGGPAGMKAEQPGIQRANMQFGGRVKRSPDAPGDAPAPRERFLFKSDQPGILGHLLHTGTVFANYDIAQAQHGSHYEIRFRLDGDIAAAGKASEAAPVVATAPDKASAHAAVDGLIDYLHRIRETAGSIYAGEELFLVEHLLLRPRPGAGDAADACTISLVFPAWPVRFQRLEFQKFAARTATDNCPAHLALRCHWLGTDHMGAFKGLHGEWRKHLAQHQAGQDHRLEAAAGRLREFLANLDHGGRARS